MSPAEMSGGCWFLSRTRRACSRAYVNLVGKRSGRRQRQQSQLYGGSETSGIGYVVRRSDLVGVHLRKTVNETTRTRRATGGKTEILTEVYDTYIIVDMIVFEEFARIAVSQAEEHDVYIGRQSIGETHVGVADKVGMYIAYKVAGVGDAMHVCQLHRGMERKQTACLSASVAGTAYNGGAYLSVCHAVIILHRLQDGVLRSGCRISCRSRAHRRRSNRGSSRRSFRICRSSGRGRNVCL